MHILLNAMGRARATSSSSPGLFGVYCGGRFQYNARTRVEKVHPKAERNKTKPTVRVIEVKGRLASWKAAIYIFAHRQSVCRLMLIMQLLMIDRLSCWLLVLCVCVLSSPSAFRRHGIFIRFALFYVLVLCHFLLNPHRCGVGDLCFHRRTTHFLHTHAYT